MKTPAFDLNRLYPIIILLFIFSCSIWEYDDLSNPIDPQKPNTYLSLIATDTVFASLDSITGQSIYAITETPDPDFVWDTLTYAFTTITTSKQKLHWWGEDEDDGRRQTIDSSRERERGVC